jgi:hypothetical protein
MGGGRYVVRHDDRTQSLRRGPIRNSSAAIEQFDSERLQFAIERGGELLH